MRIGISNKTANDKQISNPNLSNCEWFVSYFILNKTANLKPTTKEGSWKIKFNKLFKVFENNIIILLLHEEH